MHKDPLALEMMAPGSQCHGKTIHLSPVDTHELVSEAEVWELALTPVTLEVTAETQVTGICEQFAFNAGEPLSPVQQADPIPGRQVFQPPVNIRMELLGQIDSVMEIVSFCGSFNHVGKKGSTQSAQRTHKVKLAHQR